MEEVNDNSADLPAGEKSADSANTVPSLSKIYRRGDKIYQVKDENVTMIKEDNGQNKVVKELIDTQVEQVSSGESLYKTFSFDNNISKEETEKCISFWRSVVEKNLEPIKCTIIESLNNYEQSDKKGDKKVKGKDKKKLKKSENYSPLPRERRSNTWFNILEELQKKRLNQTRLLIERRCRLCEYTTSTPYETEDSKIQIKKHIKELDEWQPKSTKVATMAGEKDLRRTSINSEGKRSLGKRRRSSGSEQLSLKEKVMDQVLEEVASEVDSEYLDDPYLKSVKEASVKIEYIDAIEKKKREHVYSKWRENKVAQICECSRIECDCNTNPAVVAVINKTNHVKKDFAKVPRHLESSAPNKPSKSTEKPKIENNETELNEKENKKDSTKGYIQSESTALSKSSKDTENTTVENVNKIELTKRENQKDSNKVPITSELSTPNRPSKDTEKTIMENNEVKLFKKDDHTGADSDKSTKSTEKTAKELQVTIENQKDAAKLASKSDLSTQNILPQETKDTTKEKSTIGFQDNNLKVAATENTTGSDNSILIEVTGDQLTPNREDINPNRRSILKFKSEKSRETQKKRSKKSLSVMLQCICSNEDCDCKNTIQLSQRMFVKDFKIPKAPQRYNSLARVDSKDLIKRRLSATRQSRVSQMSE